MGTLVRTALAAPPWQVPHVISDVLTEHLGATSVQLLYADYAQRHLTALEGSTPRDHVGGWPIATDAHGPGEVFTSQRRRTSVTAGSVGEDLPLTVRGERLGVLSLRWGPAGMPHHLAGEQGRALVEQVADAVALLLRHADAGTDRIERWRRSEDFSLAAELQWAQLPAQSVVDPSFVLAAHLEPAAQVTSDAYDWSCSPGKVWFALLDATGPQERRGLASAQTVTLALTALRNARRAGADLAEQAWLADQAVAAHEGGRSQVSAVLAEIDLDRGRASVIGAGGPSLLLGEPQRRPWALQSLSEQAPLGSGDQDEYRCDDIAVEPGQWLAALSDGVAEAPDGSGQPFGLERLRDLLDDGPALDAPRRIIEAATAHSGDDLPDDASIIVFARSRDHHGQPGAT